jgi:ABC-type Fe3+/spermidine/putrescine transport system ATPase subunit
MIAGLTEIDAGRVVLHDRDVTDLPPARRGVGFVFQSYALFRGMSVAENVEFALSVRGVRRAQRRRRRNELLELVGLAGLGGRMPRQLSGGQQQRVALARALAHQPEVLLLDEPFGALDAKVRLELRRSIREIQRELGIATLFVTHDQEEAFELADRLAVLSFGRLIEVGPPEELYLRPETELAATFLGTANLMVGECTEEGVRFGPVRFPLSTQGDGATPRRVQVLFRPEDVALREAEGALGCPLLGKGVVDQRTFVGSFEKLRLRLPPLPGVRTIAPPAPFGSEELWVEASRTQEQARRFPLQPGATAWVGVQRVHALVHPGMRFLLLADGTARGTAALALGAELARLAHARVALVGVRSDALHEARERLGSGQASLDVREIPGALADAVADEATRVPCDLVVLGLSAKPPDAEVELAEEVLRAGQHHLLLVPESRGGPVPSRVLICVAVGEPGKSDVSFTGRLVRHLRAEATILTVLPQEEEERESTEVERAERFLERNRRGLSRFGVAATSSIRYGTAQGEIVAELARGGHDLLVLGAPLPRRGHRLGLGGLVGRLLPELESVPLLVVRSPEAAP